MPINQTFYTTINNLVAASYGDSTAPAVHDYASFIDAGKNITDVAGTDLQNNFVSVLMNKLALSIDVVRSYRGKYAELYRGDVRNGNTVELIMHTFFDTQAAAFTNLQDNSTVDQYEIHRPEVSATYYVDTNSYTIGKTITRNQLVKAWSSPAEMEAFIAGILGDMINSNELARERGRMGLVCGAVKDVAERNAAENSNSGAQRFKLLTLYNAEKPAGAPAVTAQTALATKEFVLFAVQTIKKVMRRTEDPSTMFNGTDIVTFTPAEQRHLFVNSALVSAMDTYIYNDNYRPDRSMLTDYIDVSHWQQGVDPLNVPIDADTEIPVLCVLSDWYALLELLQSQDMDVTPYNARGKYWNYWLNVETRYCYNKDANFVVFTLD